MSMEELKYQAKELWYRLFYSPSRVRRIYSRFVGTLIVLSLITVVGPTLAEELTGGSQNPNETTSSNTIPVESSTSILNVDSSTVTPNPTPASDSASIKLETVTLQSEDSDSTSAKFEIIPAPVENQPKFVFRFPNSIAVDPRSKSTNFPQLYVAPMSNTEYVMVCLHGNGLLIDLSHKGQADILENNVEIEGDRSSLVLLTGNPSSVMHLINSSGGMRAFSNQTGIAGKSILFQIVSLNLPATDPAFCSAASSIRGIELRALQIAQSTIKGSGKLK